MDVRGKTILVTGAGRGIGRSLALHFARKGANLALLDTNSEEVADSCVRCTEAGAVARSYIADAANEDSVVGALDQVTADFGRLDGLINNAGIVRDGLLVKVKDGLVVGKMTLAQWQAADEAHLGHLLRAMKRDFDAARAKAPCVVFTDEIDSFADRSKIRHAYADYVVEVVNGFIAQLDGAAGREGLIFLAASNDLSRCDSAILRSGRLNRVLRIGLPSARDLERMFRVRLAGRLAGEDLEEICLLALGSTGADVERITNDALRFARHAERPLELADLRRALVHQEDRTPCEIRRAAIHEAGHLLTEIVLFGHEADVQATIARSKERGGATVRTKVPPFAGTYSGYQHRLQVLLAGRTAEEIVLGAASHGAGGRRGSDLQQATAHAAAMVGSLGIGGPEQLLFLASHDDTDELLSYVDVRLAARAELIRAAEACHSLLLEHRTALEEIASTLLRAGRIDGVSAADIIHTHRNIEEPP